VRENFVILPLVRERERVKREKEGARERECD